MINLTKNMCEVLLVLFRRKPVNYHDLSRSTGLSVMGVSKIVKKLEEKNLVSVRSIGRSRVVYLFVVKDSLELFSMVEHYYFEKFLKKHSAFEGFLRSLKEKIKADFCLIFGSYASGEESTSSDLDILIVSSKDTMEEFNTVKALLPIEVTPLFITKKDFIEGLGKNKRLYTEIYYGKRVLVVGAYQFWESVCNLPPLYAKLRGDKEFSTLSKDNKKYWKKWRDSA